MKVNMNEALTTDVVNPVINANIHIINSVKKILAILNLLFMKNRRFITNRLSIIT